MSGKLHALAALSVAVALHLAAFAWRPPVAGATASGSGGDALVSLEASSGSIAQMVEEWERAPEPVAEPEPQLPQPEMVQPDPPPQLALPDMPETPLPVPTPMMALPEAPEMPDMDIAELPPPEPEAEPEPEPEPAPEPLPETRPEPRPEPEPEPEPKPRAEPQPRRQPATPPSASAPAQRAAGSGGGAFAGAAGSAESATSRARANDLKAGWGAAIRARVERRKSYPRDAGSASGTVTVEVSVARNGALLGVAVTSSSGSPALDAALLKAVRAAGRFPAAPAGLGEASYSFILPMSFSP